MGRLRAMHERNEKKNRTCPSLVLTKAGQTNIFENSVFLTNSVNEQNNRSVSIQGLVHHYRLSGTKFRLLKL